MATPGIKKQQVRNTKSHQSGKGAASTSRSHPVPDTRLEKNRPGPAFEQIARLAYSYWQARKGEGGSAEEDWLRAERELTLQLKQDLASKIERGRGHGGS